MAGVGRGGYRTYGCEHDDVDECRSQIYGNLNRTTIPYSEDRTEGAMLGEFVRKPRVGHVRVQALADGASIPTKSETQRTGLTLATIESVEIQPLLCLQDYYCRRLMRDRYAFIIAFRDLVAM